MQEPCEYLLLTTTGEKVENVTCEVVQLLLLEQADSVVISFQHELRLRVLTHDRLAPEGFLRLHHIFFRA